MRLTMQGRLGCCYLLAYRTPAESVEPLVPRGLRLMTVGKWAFWNIVACRVERMRPTGFPAWTGLSYHHVAYRLYVNAKTADGEVIEGLHFIRSDADSRVLSWSGNRFSDFNFNASPIKLSTEPEAILNVGGSMPASFRAVATSQRTLVPDSCFATVDAAAKTLTYRPLGLSVNRAGTQLNLAEVFRDATQWREHPLTIQHANWQFFERMNQRDTALELATTVAPIDYRWRLGQKRTLMPNDPIEKRDGWPTRSEAPSG